MQKVLSLPVALFVPLALFLLFDLLEVRLGMEFIGLVGTGIAAAAAVVLGPLAIFRSVLGAGPKTNVRIWLGSAAALLASCSWLFFLLIVVVNFHLTIGGAK